MAQSHEVLHAGREPKSHWSWLYPVASHEYQCTTYTRDRGIPFPTYASQGTSVSRGPPDLGNNQPCLSACKHERTLKSLHEHHTRHRIIVRWQELGPLTNVSYLNAPVQKDSRHRHNSPGNNDPHCAEFPPVLLSISERKHLNPERTLSSTSFVSWKSFSHQ